MTLGYNPRPGDNYTLHEEPCYDVVISLAFIKPTSLEKQREVPNEQNSSMHLEMKSPQHQELIYVGIKLVEPGGTFSKFSKSHMIHQL